jgi:hypothetical protein
MNYYTNVLTAFKWISITVATILKLRVFRRIIEHFPLREHYSEVADPKMFKRVAV